MLKKLERWKQDRRTRRELEGLSDRELSDIGINRSDIKWVVAQTR